MIALIIGAKGQLGRQLMKDLAITKVGIARDDLDLGADKRSKIQYKLSALLDRYQPDLVINAAAYTAVDRAEAEYELALQINGWFPAVIARCATNVPIIHFSTDYVFDGESDYPYGEADRPNPLSVYGRTKWIGEQKLLEQTSKALIMRCSWVLGSWGQNFAKTILRLALTKSSIQVINDQWGVPTPCRFLVQQISYWLTTSRAFGLFHVVPSGKTTWFDYANLIIGQAGQHPFWCSRLLLSPRSIQPIRSMDFPAIASRPKNSQLDTSRWREVTGQCELDPWKPIVLSVIDEILDKDQHSTDL
jgi:dTDP-4-dehydrorhamnose reductase